MDGRRRLCAIVCALTLAAVVGAYVGRRPARGASAVQGNVASAKGTTVDGGAGADGAGADGAGADGAGHLAEGRGKKKKKKKKTGTKNAWTNAMVGGGVMAAVAVIVAFLNAITVTLVKALLFTFVAKFLVSANWISSGPSSKRKPGRKGDVTVVLE